MDLLQCNEDFTVAGLHSLQEPPGCSQINDVKPKPFVFPYFLLTARQPALFHYRCVNQWRPEQKWRRWKGLDLLRICPHALRTFKWAESSLTSPGSL